ncbi:MAG: peptidase [Zymomonas sp.]|nr:peptidase [Zymomonas sp.]
MTYCLGILLPTGLVFASDSRSNAGVDQIATVRKMQVMARSAGRFVTVLSAGNLATTQWVTTTLREAAGSGDAVRDIDSARTMLDVAKIVGDLLRTVVDRDSKYVGAYGDPGGSFIVGGQIAGEPPRLFQIYAAGNFIEASDRSRFLQIGETKYGKPILDRGLSASTTLDEAGKLALLSFDATIRSNLSVGAPIDLLRYADGSYSGGVRVTFDETSPYWQQLRQDYGEGLSRLVAGLPPPPSGIM